MLPWMPDYIERDGEEEMSKKLMLKKPPMGWNSYDYYDTTVNEDQIKSNADYMAKNLKKYGWEYVVDYYFLSVINYFICSLFW